MRYQTKSIGPNAPLEAAVIDEQPDPGLNNCVLIIDDDVITTSSLRAALEDSGYSVDVMPEVAWPITSRDLSVYVLVVVDIMISRLDDKGLLRRIRQSTARPVLVLTARGDEESKVAALDRGADDYVVKPSNPREVVARIGALLRRYREGASSASEADILKSGRLTMWPALRHAEWCGATLRLTSTEFSLLEVLLRKVGRPVSKFDLAKYALGREPELHARSIDVHLCNVRRKLGVLADGRSLIQAVYRQGYQLIKE